jgi:hypothetical protein
MTVPEVLDASGDYDIFGAESDFPYDKNAAGDDFPSVGLRRTADGTYRTYDLAAQPSIAITETQAVERLHAKLHDGYPWRFYFTYINMTDARFVQRDLWPGWTGLGSEAGARVGTRRGTLIDFRVLACFRYLGQ